MGSRTLKVAVTGASGFVGSALIRSLLRENHQVLAITRKPLSFVRGPAQLLVDDLFDIDKYSEKLADVDVVVHAAATVHTVGKPLEIYRRVNIDATLQLARLAIASGVSRFIFISSIAVYGKSSSKSSLSEETHLSPNSHYAQSKAEAENQLISLFSNVNDCDLVITRPPLVYGLEAPGNFARLLWLSSKNIMLPFAACGNRRSMISIDNFVDFLCFCLTEDSVSGQVFVVSDHSPVSTNGLVASLRRGMNKPSRLFKLPRSLMRLLLFILGQKELFNQLYGDLVIDTSKVKSLTGWRPSKSTTDSLLDIGASYSEKNI